MPVHEADNPGSSVLVGNSSTPVVAENLSRGKLWITNDSDTVIYLRLAETGAIAHTGIRLNPDGGAWEEKDWQGPICAVTASGSGKRLCIAEK